jgi:hypothetical protein
MPSFTWNSGKRSGIDQGYSCGLNPGKRDWPTYAGLGQREVLGVVEPELVEPLGLGPAHLARGGGLAG